MATYFSIIPVEVLTLIFIKVEEPYHIEKLLGTDFDVVLSSASAWKLKIKLYFKDITWEVIPKSLLDYQNDEPIKSLYIYDRLYWAYDASKKMYDNTLISGNTLDFNLVSINNFDVLTLKYTEKVDSITEKRIYKLCYAVNSGMEFTTTQMHDALQIHPVSDHFEFELITDYGVGRYKVSNRDVFNAIIHIYCNGGISM